MRPALPRLWPVGALVIALTGCQAVVPTAQVNLPGGVIPDSHQMRPAQDASRLVTSATPRPRVVALPPKPVLLPPLVPTVSPPAAVLEWHGDIRPVQALAQLDRPVPVQFAPRPIARVEPAVYSHAADYAWLLGCLVHDTERNRWTVRYAHPGEPAPYDGVLELVSTGPMAGFHSGQFVRVEGALVDPQPHEIKPAYRVHVIQAIRR